MKKMRKTFLILLVLIPLGSVAQSLQRQIENIIAGRDAEVGVAVIISGRDIVTVNNERRYPMMSVMKFHQSLYVADWLSRRGLAVDTMIHVGLEEMRPGTWSPMRDEYPDGEVGLTVAELLRYTLQQSDNNACDVLFDRTGGPAATDRYMRSLGIDGFSISATEDDMHTDVSRCMDNYTTPLAAAQLVERFVAMRDSRHGVLDYIWEMMTQCATGTGRLPAPFKGIPAVIAHKTGTGDRDSRGKLIGINDVGHVILPDGRHYSIAVFVNESSGDMASTEKIIADISGVVYEYVVKMASLR